MNIDLSSIIVEDVIRLLRLQINDEGFYKPLSIAQISERLDLCPSIEEIEDMIPETECAYLVQAELEIKIFEHLSNICTSTTLIEKRQGLFYYGGPTEQCLMGDLDSPNSIGTVIDRDGQLKSVLRNV